MTHIEHAASQDVQGVAPAADTAPGHRTRRLLGDLVRRLPRTAVAATALVAAAACSETTARQAQVPGPTLTDDLAAAVAPAPRAMPVRRVDARALLAHPDVPHVVSRREGHAGQAPRGDHAGPQSASASPSRAEVIEHEPLPPVAESRPRVQEAQTDDEGGVVPERVRAGGRRVRDAIADDAEYIIRDRARQKSTEVLRGTLKRIGL